MPSLSARNDTPFQQARAEVRLPIHEIARRANTTSRTVRRAAHRRPGTPNAERIAKALGTTPGQLWPAEISTDDQAPAGNVYRLRCDQGLTITELARRAGVHRRTVERMERGMSVKPRSWRLVLEALGAPPSPRVADYDAPARDDLGVAADDLARVVETIKPVVPDRYSNVRGRVEKALLLAVMESTGHSSGKEPRRVFDHVVRHAATHGGLENIEPPTLDLMIITSGGVRGHARKVRDVVAALRGERVLIDHIGDLSVDSAVDVLSSLPHVGERVARRALYHAYGVPLYAPDMHQLRAATRLQLLAAGASVTDLAALIAQASHPGQGARVHGALSKVASEHCTVGRFPDCARCPLRKPCPGAATWS